MLVTAALVAVLAAAVHAALSGAARRADRTDALSKMRAMGSAVLRYSSDHQGRLPPLFPGQVLEYEEGRGGRLVTECADYLGIEKLPGRHLVSRLMPRAYRSLKDPSSHAAMRVYVMNSSIASGSATVSPFGRVVTAGQPPVGPSPLVAVAGAFPSLWMMSNADRMHPAVASAPWQASAPTAPPLGDVRAVFRFDGSAGLENILEP